MPEVTITHVIDSQGERAISGTTSVASPFKLKGTDTAGQGGNVTLMGSNSFPTQPYSANSGGVWQTDDFTVSSGSYSGQATCSDTMQQSNVISLSVT